MGTVRSQSHHCTSRGPGETVKEHFWHRAQRRVLPFRKPAFHRVFPPGPEFQKVSMGSHIPTARDPRAEIPARTASAAPRPALRNVNSPAPPRATTGSPKLPTLEIAACLGSGASARPSPSPKHQAPAPAQPAKPTAVPNTLYKLLVRSLVHHPQAPAPPE